LVLFVHGIDCPCPFGTRNDDLSFRHAREGDSKRASGKRCSTALVGSQKRSGRRAIELRPRRAPFLACREAAVSAVEISLALVPRVNRPMMRHTVATNIHLVASSAAILASPLAPQKD